MLDLTGYYKGCPPTVNQRRQIGNLCQLLGRVDRTLSERDVVLVRDMAAGISIDAPAYSDQMGNIFIDFAHTAFKSVAGEEAFIHALGLNYHELAHVMFTTATMQMQNDLGGVYTRTAWNLLEDGRIERLICGEYAALRKFLNHSFTVLVSHNVDPDFLWAMLAPRIRELPPELVNTIRAAYVALPNRKYDDATMKKMVDIARQYSDLVMPSKHWPIALRLIRQYADLLESAYQNPVGPNNIERDAAENSNHESVSRAHRTRTADRNLTEQKAAEKERTAQEKEEAKEAREQEKVEQAEQADSDADDADDDADDAAESDSDSTESGSSADSEAGDSEAEESGSEDSSTDGSDQESESKSESKSGSKSDSKTGTGKQGGSGEGSEEPSFSEQVLEAFEEVREDIVADEEVQSEISLHRSMLRGSGFMPGRKEMAPIHALHPSDNDRRVVRQTALEYQKIEAELDPGWDRRMPSGKLNPSRFLRERDLDSAFDSWRDDRSEAVGLEVAVLLDLSQSMLDEPGLVQKASTAFWIIRSALQSIRANVTGYGFGREPELLFRREKNADRAIVPVWNANSGTRVIQALEEVLPIFYRTRHKSKLLIVLTDGEFQEPAPEVAQVLATYKAENIHTVMFGLGIGYQNGHLFESAYPIKAPEEMILPTREIVKALIRKASKR